MRTHRRIALVCAAFVLVATLGLWSGVSRAQDNFGSNWTGQYYNNPTLSGAPLITRLDPAINFNWDTAAPDPALPVDGFSVRWTTIQNFLPGTYEFVAGSDDGIRVFVGGQLIINSFFPREYAEDRVTVQLIGGNTQIVVEYFDDVNIARALFFWRPLAVQQPGLPGQPGFPGQPIFVATATPAPTLTPSVTPTITRTPLPPIPAGALTATVIRATRLNVRSGPFIGADVLGRVQRGETYQVVGRDERAQWFLLELGGRQGWAWGYYLFVNGNEFNAPVVNPFIPLGMPESETGVVVQSRAGLRLRAAPTVNSAQTGLVRWGSLVPALGRSADGRWVQVVWLDTVGWVSAQYVATITGDVADLPVRE